ncbi:MAG: polyamine aminopropyltransferase [Methanobacteriota archaeon]|nr:MAG: polyamine aminopropyltransferase [Euryarchaeota archaeon]
MGVTFTEYYPEVNGSFTIPISKVLYNEHSPYQKIDIVESPQFGRVLLLDDMIMLTEKDEFIYHEMIAHVPMFVHPNPREILVIGGGDGGTVRELLRHPEVEHIDLVDIDEMVSQACLKYIPSVAGKLLSEKVTCRFEDGVKYIANTQKRYDVIIVDSTDPDTVGEGLFTTEFYQHCYRVLKDDGILVNQSESPAWQQKAVKQIIRKLKTVFDNLHFYQAHIPTYPSGHWAFGFGTKKYHPLNDFQEQRYDNSNLKFKYYNKDIHRGAFALPTFFREMIDEG